MFGPRTPIAIGDPLGRTAAHADRMADPQFRRTRPGLRHATLTACAAALAALAGAALSASRLIRPAEPPSVAGRQPRASKQPEPVGASVDLFDTAPPASSDMSPVQCIGHLLAANLDCLGGQQATVQDLIARARDAGDDGARNTLLDYGLKCAPFPRTAGAPVCLLVATAHPRLARLFLGTPWSDRRWSTSLRALPGAAVPRNPISYRKGVKPRAVAVPLESLACVAETNPPQPAPIPDANAQL